MAEWRKSYTPEEDQKILAYCDDAKKEGKPWNTTYIVLSDILLRPVKSITNRHRRLMKDRDGGRNSINKLSEGERLILKLKNIKHENSRNAEKSELYKEKYDDLNREYKEIKKKYQILVQEHQALIATVKEALGEINEEDQSKETEEAS